MKQLVIYYKKWYNYMIPKLKGDKSYAYNRRNDKKALLGYGIQAW